MLLRSAVLVAHTITTMTALLVRLGELDDSITTPSRAWDTTFTLLNDVGDATMDVTVTRYALGKILHKLQDLDEHHHTATEQFINRARDAMKALERANPFVRLEKVYERELAAGDFEALSEIEVDLFEAATEMDRARGKLLEELEGLEDVVWMRELVDVAIVRITAVEYGERGYLDGRELEPIHEEVMEWARELEIKKEIDEMRIGGENLADLVLGEMAILDQAAGCLYGFGGDVVDAFVDGDAPRSSESGDETDISSITIATSIDEVVGSGDNDETSALGRGDSEKEISTFTIGAGDDQETRALGLGESDKAHERGRVELEEEHPTHLGCAELGVEATGFAGREEMVPLGTRIELPGHLSVVSGSAGIPTRNLTSRDARIIHQRMIPAAALRASNVGTPENLGTPVAAAVAARCVSRIARPAISLARPTTRSEGPSRIPTRGAVVGMGVGVGGGMGGRPSVHITASEGLVGGQARPALVDIASKSNTNTTTNATPAPTTVPRLADNGNGNGSVLERTLGTIADVQMGMRKEAEAKRCEAEEKKRREARERREREVRERRERKAREVRRRKGMGS